MSTPKPMYTRLREHVERGVELIEEAMRDGEICEREQLEIYRHHQETLSLSEEHEFTSQLAMSLLHGGMTRRTYYAAREYDRTYGTGELSEHIA